MRTLTFPTLLLLASADGKFAKAVTSEAKQCVVPVLARNKWEVNPEEALGQTS